MSGHSHFKTIKYKKEIADNKRGKIFSKLSKAISIAAKERGGDPITNAGLRLAIEKAKECNMPKDNIERAIKKGTGELAGEQLEAMTFELFGPGGIAVIIEGITDNKNRSLGEIKQVINQNNSKLASEGAVRWMFEKKGCIVLSVEEQEKDFQDKEKLEIAAIESGAQDFKQNDDEFYVYTNPEELNQVKNKLESQGIKTNSMSLDWVAKEEIDIDPEKKNACQKLFEGLDELDSVQEVYSNLKN
ncbi:MAG: hypothetical protein US98_C0023G0004 [Parcubacteria group bacterium GW2011_GWC1_38_6]|nr:MAG: hypothetical protein UR98_C0002G0059 [Parcubacteria group bacterium GW2011_GWA1_36_12]KKQ76828.1 MAG: hypothetical protein US98_C0023G0004 [Parcubacteria group bacterium GW2011_GWC1_38_6]